MNFFSMFSGIGGFDLGLEQAGHTCVGACEADGTAASIYSRHWPRVPMWERDVRTVHPDALPYFDLLVGGFPCQPFSTFGLRRGLGDSRGSLFSEAMRVAECKGVPYILLENVPGILSNDDGDAFYQLLSEMDECGYDAEWQCINGKHFLPQNRERVFIVGRLRGARTRQVLPVPKDGGFGGEVRETPGGRPSDRLPDAPHTRTITAGYYKSQNPLIAESGGRLRMLTPVECERLQGFPDGWTEFGADGKRVSNTARYRCIGNAVMVPVVKFLGDRLGEAWAS